MEYTTHLSCNPKQLDSLKARAMIADSRQERECHPLSCSFPRDLARNLDRQCFYRPQLGINADSHGELFPLQSPLLRESLLVSFPPLNYMLKFRGYPYQAEIRLENKKLQVALLPLTSSRHRTACYVLLELQHHPTRMMRVYQMSALSVQDTLAIQTQGVAYKYTATCFSQANVKRDTG